MVDFNDLGFPKNVTTEELRERLKLAAHNRMQLDMWTEVVTQELVRRGRQ